MSLIRRWIWKILWPSMLGPQTILYFKVENMYRICRRERRCDVRDETMTMDR